MRNRSCPTRPLREVAAAPRGGRRMPQNAVFRGVRRGFQQAATRRFRPLLLSLWLVPATPVHAEGTSATTEDGVRIYYETMGTGIPIVMIAGGPGADSSHFRYTHSLLRSCGQLVFLDNRGRGRSEGGGDLPEAYTLENDLKDVEAVRKALGAERIIIYGHSYGSMVALAYAARFPQHTLAVATTAGVHGARVWQERNIDGVKRHLEYQYPQRWARITELHQAGELTGKGKFHKLFEGLEELYTYHPESVSRLHEQFEGYRDPKAITWNGDVYHAMIGQDPEWTLDGTLSNVELLPELKNYQGPALIMGGRFDRICPPVSQLEIAEALANARLVIFEHSGHAPFTEEPLRFLQVFSSFLCEVAPEEK